jgi:dethiobiotin synthetase
MSKENRPICIAGIHTGIGKTLVSAVVCHALQADYWKPIQAGDTDRTDSMRVRQLSNSLVTKVHPEAWVLGSPQSPHHAAQMDSVEINLEKLQLPYTSNELVIETAGGLYSPIDKRHCMVDLIEKFNARVILVSRHYLGSINHTLMSLHLLKQRKIPVLGLIYSGADFPSSSTFISEQFPEIPFFHLGEVDETNRELVHHMAEINAPTLQLWTR